MSWKERMASGLGMTLHRSAGSCSSCPATTNGAYPRSVCTGEGRWAGPRQTLIRGYVAEDAAATWRVFYAAVHGTASRDYTHEQVAAWAPPDVDEASWHERRAEATTYVACNEQRIVGFADFTDDGVLDMLFVHPDAGDRGIARALVDRVLREARTAGHRSLRVHAGRTAVPALRRFGFTLHGSRLPEVRGQRLENFDMSIALAAAQP